MLNLLKRILASPSFIIVIAFSVRMGFLIHDELGLPVYVNAFQPFGYETGSIARSIATGHGFASPITGLETGPTAWLTPVFPYLLAAVFRLFGVYTAASHLVIQTLNCAFAAFTCLPLYLIARRFFDPWVAVGTAWFWTFTPQSIYFSTSWVWDTSLCALLTAWLVLLTLQLAESGEHRNWRWAGYGALWALSILTNATFLVLAPFLFCWLGRHRSGQRLACAVPLTIATLVLLVSVSPWLARNYLALHKFVPFRSNFGLELFLGNNPAVVDGFSWWLHPTDNADEAKLFASMGELRYMAAKQEEAIRYIRTHPGEFAWLTGNRFVFTWTETQEPIAEMWPNGNWRLRAKWLYLYTTCLLAFFGLYLSYRRRLPASIPLALVLLIFPAIYYITHTNARYRHPIDPILALLVVFAVRETYLLMGARSLPPNRSGSGPDGNEIAGLQELETVSASSPN